MTVGDILSFVGGIDVSLTHMEVIGDDYVSYQEILVRLFTQIGDDLGVDPKLAKNKEYHSKELGITAAGLFNELEIFVEEKQREGFWPASVGAIAA